MEAKGVCISLFYRLGPLFCMVNEMTDNISSNKRIAKNTLLLYARMLLLLLVSLYTSRVVLATLGFEDYGIYNVVGGIVVMFTFISKAMGNSTSRYITFAIGKGDKTELNNVVGVSFFIHWVLAGIILVLAETIGLWFLFNKMVIPDGRMTAAFWVFQFSVISCMVSIINVPFNSMIIAHEKMGAFASISILDALLKLLIVYFIQISPFDRLIFYAALLLIVELMDRVIYQIYCHRKFEEARNIKYQRSGLVKEMISFASYSLLGNAAYLLQNQGLNIVINTFFNTVVNAARGIAFQIQGVIKGFIVNFQTATFPQITKSYAAKEYARMFDLICFVSKFSFFLVLFLSLPIFLEADLVLTLWLKSFPPHTINFLRIILLISMLETLANPLATAVSATGNIKSYQIILSMIDLCIVPVAYLALKIGCEVEWVFVIQLIIMCLEQLTRIFLCHKRVQLSYRNYFNHVLLRVFVVSAISVLIPIVLYLNMDAGYLRFFLVCGTSVICVLGSSFFMGMNVTERRTIIEYVTKFIKRNHNC